MVDGTSTESLALEVARKFALPPAILRRATSLYQVAPPFRSPFLHRGPFTLQVALSQFNPLFVGRATSLFQARSGLSCMAFCPARPACLPFKQPTQARRGP